LELYPAELELKTLMFNFIFRFFRKKQIKDELDKAFLMGLITEEELYRLRLERAEEKYKEFIKKKK
jgi:hypothetical protein